MELIIASSLDIILTVLKGFFNCTLFKVPFYH